MTGLMRFDVAKWTALRDGPNNPILSVELEIDHCQDPASHNGPDPNSGADRRPDPYTFLEDGGPGGAKKVGFNQFCIRREAQCCCMNGGNLLSP